MLPVASPFNFWRWRIAATLYPDNYTPLMRKYRDIAIYQTKPVKMNLSSWFMIQWINNPAREYQNDASARRKLRTVIEW